MQPSLAPTQDPPTQPANELQSNPAPPISHTASPASPSSPRSRSSEPFLSPSMSPTPRRPERTTPTELGRLRRLLDSAYNDRPSHSDSTRAACAPPQCDYCSSPHPHPRHRCPHRSPTHPASPFTRFVPAAYCPASTYVRLLSVNTALPTTVPRTALRTSPPGLRALPTRRPPLQLENGSCPTTFRRRMSSGSPATGALAVPRACPSCTPLNGVCLICLRKAYGAVASSSPTPPAFATSRSATPATPATPTPSNCAHSSRCATTTAPPRQAARSADRLRAFGSFDLGADLLVLATGSGLPTILASCCIIRDQVIQITKSSLATWWGCSAIPWWCWRW